MTRARGKYANQESKDPVAKLNFAPEEREAEAVTLKELSSES
jgi:hypothetical protein